VIGATRLYTWDREEHECVTFVIQTGPLFKDYKPHTVVLVNPDGYFYKTNDVPTGRLRVDGTLFNGIPLCKDTGQPLVMHSKDESKCYELQWLIKVNRLELLP
jgi:hypothetical protein